MTTNSGSGGGGALQIRPKKDERYLFWLAAYMCTEIFFKYVDIVGTMQLSNDEKTWRGIDKSRIDQCPYPLPSDNDLNYSEEVVLEIIKSKTGS